MKNTLILKNKKNELMGAGAGNSPFVFIFSKGFQGQSGN